MTLFLASIFLGIVPMVIYALIIWRIDRWEKEPFPLMLAAFLWGSVPAVIFALIAQVILSIPLVVMGGDQSLWGELYEASLVAPVTEEIIKGIGLALIFYKFRREIDSILDGLIYGSMIGFGFSAVEDVLYFASMPDAASLAGLFFLRTILFGMLHAFFTGLFGVGLAMGKFSKHTVMKWLWPLLGLAAAIGTHALHNTFATLGEEYVLLAILGYGIGLVWFGLTIAVCLYHENRWIRIHLSEEVERGVLYAEQAIDTAHFWTRSSLSILTHGFAGVMPRRRLLHQATELAYEKQRQLRFGSTPGGDKRLSTLREEVRALSRKDPMVISGKIQPGRRLPPPLPPTRRQPPPLPS